MTQQNQMPEHLRQAYNPDEMGDFGEVSFPSIGSPEKNVFAIRFGEEETKVPAPLGVVILKIDPPGRAKNRAYFEGAYDPESSAEAPDCASSDGVKPTAGDSIQAENCSPKSEVNPNGCPHSIWGSEPARGKGQACSEHKDIYVVLADYMQDPGAMILKVRLSSTALKNLATYGNLLKQCGVPLNGIVTMLKHNPDETYQQIMFERGVFLDAPAFQITQERKTAPELMQLTGPAPVPALPAPAPATKPIEEPPVVDAPQQESPAGPAQEVATGKAETAKDANGVPWSEKFHTAIKGIKADGTWKARKGLSDVDKTEAVTYAASFAAPTVDVSPPAAPPAAAPPPPPVEKVAPLTNSDGHTYDDVKTAGWSDEQMLADPKHAMLVPTGEVISNSGGESALDDALSKFDPDANAGGESALDNALSKWPLNDAKK